jgi:hypothetical protein
MKKCCCGFSSARRVYMECITLSNSSQCFLTFPNHLCGCKENYFIASLLLIHLYGDRVPEEGKVPLSSHSQIKIPSSKLLPTCVCFLRRRELFFVCAVSEGPNPSKVVVILCANTHLDSLQIICWARYLVFMLRRRQSNGFTFFISPRRGSGAER